MVTQSRLKHCSINKQQQLKRMKDVFHLSRHRKAMYKIIPANTVLLLVLQETFSGAPAISFQPSWSQATTASFQPLTSWLGPVTLRTHSFNSLQFQPRLLSGQSGFSLGKKPSSNTSLFPILLPAQLLLCYTFFSTTRSWFYDSFWV